MGIPITKAELLDAIRKYVKPVAAASPKGGGVTPAQAL
jgi:hypothetical protein